jgi:hypothetical protein
MLTLYTDTYQMTNGTNSKVDIPLPNTKLLEVIRDRGFGSKDAATDTMQIDGIHYIVSARCANPNMYIDAESGKYLRYCSLHYIYCILIPLLYTYSEYVLISLLLRSITPTQLLLLVMLVTYDTSCNMHCRIVFASMLTPHCCHHVACTAILTGRQFETEQWNGETKCQRMLVQAMPRSAVKSIEMSALQWQYIALAQQLLKAIALVFISLRAFKYVSAYTHLFIM